MNIDSKVTYAMHAYNTVNVTNQEDNTNVLLKLLLYIILRYFI